MAVADVAVQIGPRNTRRLTAGAITLVVAVAIATAALLERPSTPAGPTLSSQSASHVASKAETFFHLVYGLNRKQVLAKVGKPTKTVGNCWEYRLNVEIRGGQNLLNAMRLCFSGGGYAYSYSEIDGKWFYPTDSLVPSR
jgi:hypothetical protein